MLAPRPSGFLRLAVIGFLALPSQFCLPMPGLAQSGATDTVDGRLIGGSITVAVRNSAGEPLTTPTVVRLYSSDGRLLGQASVVSGGQATFLNVRPGTYEIEAEASGYLKGNGEAVLPMVGEASVQIYLRPDPNADPIILSVPETSMPLLAPKARKELEAGRQALRAKDFEKAQHHLEKAVQLAPDHPEVLYLLGSLCAETKDWSRSEGYFAKAAQLQPKYAAAQAGLGIVLSNEARYEAAVPPLVIALELNGLSWEARWALSRCYYHLHKYDLALAESRHALHDSNGGAPEISLVVAASLSATGQYEDSATVLRKFLNEHSELPGAARARRWLSRLQESGKIHSD